jgi:uncharacterized paraquat-inducible protein A
MAGEEVGGVVKEEPPEPVCQQDVSFQPELVKVETETSHCQCPFCQEMVDIKARPECLNCSFSLKSKSP